MDIINNLLPKIEHFRMLGYWIVLLVCLLESIAFVGVLVPGAFIVVAFGSLAAQGYFDLGDLIWFAALGAIIGDGISFALGKKGKVLFSDDSRFFKASYLTSGYGFFSRHGAKSVFLARFIAPLRGVVPFIAGLSGMDTGRFYFWNVLSALAWTVTHLVPGYFLGHAWRLVEVWSSRFGIFLAAVAIFLACGYLLKMFLMRKGKQLLDFIASIMMSVSKSIMERPFIGRLINDHPRTASFLRGRLRTGHFTGLPLTFLLVAFIYILLLLMGVIEDIVTSDTIVTVDRNIENLLFLYRDPALVKVFLWITVFGRLNIILVLALAVLIILWLRDRVSFIAPLLITLSGSYLFVILGKEALHRPRPVGLAVYHEYFFSFPSGHATIATAVYGYLVYYLWTETEAWKNRLNILFTAGIAIAAVGFSRMYLGAHFLSDIIGGFLLGLLWLIIGICVRELREPPPAERPLPAIRPMKTKIYTAVIIAFVCGFYIYSAYNFHPARYFPEQEQLKVIAGNNIMQIFTIYHLPEYTESITGAKQQPLSLVITAKDNGTLAEAFKKAGWQMADPVDPSTLAKTANSFIFNKSYPLAPMTPSFWDDRANDLNFVKTRTVMAGRKRHEARFWSTNYITTAGGRIYVGTAVFSESPSWRIIPRIGPNPDKERNGLLSDLELGGEVTEFTRSSFVPPMSARSFAGSPFHTDGDIVVIRLK
ncbi:MAG TPA: LssY C-terminal domain-containing protein [Geobacteraceae bacterium]|nr:LssY C-terminal domain-containing protein [Geobacteraceae bacterium]